MDDGTDMLSSCSNVDNHGKRMRCIAKTCDGALCRLFIDTLAGKSEKENLK